MSYFILTRPQFFLFGAVVLLFIVSERTVCGQDTKRQQGEVLQTFFAKYCLGCHGEEVQEANLRLDDLEFTASQRVRWDRVADVVESLEMPPPDALQPAAADRRRVVTAIGQGLARNSARVPALRRLSRVEYEHTVHDLLGIDAPLATLLPEDAQIQGFDNVATGLGISPILMERYLEAANVAFEKTIRRIPPLPPATRRLELMENKDNVASVRQGKGGVIESHGAFVDFTPGWPPARVDSVHPIEDGRYRCRIAVWPHDPGSQRTLSVAVFTGPLFGVGKRIFRGIYDVTGGPDDPRIIEFAANLREGDALHILPWVYPEHVTWRDKHEARPGVAVLWAETHGPLDQSFPADTQTRLFGDAESLRMEAGIPFWMRHRRGVKLHHVASETPTQDVERILREFAPRAFRRPVDERLIQQFVRLALARFEQGSSFEDSVRAGVVAMLCSPHFLLVNHEPASALEGEGSLEIDDYTLASRLSYFLWCSMPDGELLSLAAQSRLRDPQVRREQVRRMLRDEKSERFVKNFTGQWLDLREIEFTTPDQNLYPEYDELLLRSMVAETEMFFEYVLQNDLSVTSFVDSDFAILNQRLAAHYGIEGVVGHEEMRVVKLSNDCIRGGIMTHASVLKVTANGTTTSPILRGAWVLDRLLGLPAPPPPAGVPAVEPDIRGAVTIRQQLQLHRDNESCRRCHARIDPAGFALEEFDVIGGHREQYRTLEGDGPRVPKTRYHLGALVQSDGELIDGTSFGDFSEYRAQLLAQPDLVTRSLAKKLLVYGCGRPVTRAEQDSVDYVVEQTRQRGYGLRAMVEAIVDSPLFLSP